MKRDLIVELPNGSFRPATRSESKSAREAETHRLGLEAKLAVITKELESIESSCNHPVCYDTEGMPYNVRHCLRCGNGSLL